jgi:putative membrane protein
MEEVELGKVAVRNASHDKVKAFGQHMIDDHSKGGDELKMIASKNNITLPDSFGCEAKSRSRSFFGFVGSGV